MASGAQIAEVLPQANYDQGHLPGAISLPLKQLDAGSAAVLDRDRPVVVYCWDWLCDLSPRAAARLDALGFTEVYDYVAGKLDWIANRMPMEGEQADAPNVGHCTHEDVVTCRLDDQVGAVGARIERSPYPFGLVTTQGGVLLGRLRSSMLDCDPGLRAEEVMEPGPKTFRPHKSASGIASELAERNLRWAIVTTPEGELIGVASRVELEAASA